MSALIAQAEALDASFEKWWLEQQNDFRGFVTSKGVSRAAWHACGLQAVAEQPAQAVADWYYEWDTAFGLHRSFSPSPWNGAPPTRTVRIYAHPDPRIAQLEADLAAAQAERDEARAEIAALQAKVTLFESSLNTDHTHRCIGCALAYTPVDSNEDCPGCGCNGQDAAIEARKEGV